jgi:hypothetical protein
VAEEFLARLDRKIRAAEAEVWANEAARDSFVLGLMAARSAYTGMTPLVPYRAALDAVLGPGFERPGHAKGCRGHRHGLGGCLARGCGCALRPTRVEESRG